MKFFGNCDNQHYVNRPFYLFEINTIEYAPVVLNKPWVIDWTYKCYNINNIPAKWYDKMLWFIPKEATGAKSGRSLNTHNWMRILSSIAFDAAYYRKIKVMPTKKAFYFCGKKIFFWKTKKV